MDKLLSSNGSFIPIQAQKCQLPIAKCHCLRKSSNNVFFATLSGISHCWYGKGFPRWRGGLVCCVCLFLCLFVLTDNMFAFVFERPYFQATPGDDPLSWTEPYHRAQACHIVTCIQCHHCRHCTLLLGLLFLKGVSFTDNTSQNCCYYKC